MRELLSLKFISTEAYENDSTKLNINAYDNLDLKLPERDELVSGTENLNRYLNILPTIKTLVSAHHVW